MQYIKKYSYLVFFLCINILAIFYSNNLQNINKETLFLSTEGREKYSEFLKIIPEKKVLATKIQHVSSFDSTSFTQLMKTMDGLTAKLNKSDIKIITFQSIYDEKQELNNLSKIVDFYKMYPKLKLKLIDQNSFSFLVVFQDNTNTYKIEKTIKTIENTFQNDNTKVSFSGLPYTNYLLNQYSKDIKTVLFPVIFIFSFILILLLTKNILNSLIIFIPALFSVPFTLSIIKLLFSNVHMITSVVPLLIFVINLSLCFHLYFTTYSLKSFDKAIKTKKVPIILMILTTSIGFGSLIISEIEVIRQFAIVSLISIILSTTQTLLFFTSIFKAFKINIDLNQFIFSSSCSNLFKKTLPKSISIIICIIICVFSYLCISKITVITDATEYFSKKTNIKKDIQLLEKKLIGNPNFEILLSPKTDNEFTFSDITRIWNLENVLISTFKDQYKILSINQFIADANLIYSKTHTIPNLSLPYYFLKTKVPLIIKQTYPSNTGYRITLAGNTVNFEKYKKELEKIDIILKTFSNDVNFQVNGLYYNLMHSQNSLIKILAKSFLLSLAIISLIIYIYFKKIKSLLLFIVINTIPPASTIIFIYLAGLSFNIATVMTFSISLGMIVDSTLHLTHSLINKEQYTNLYKHTLLPIICSSILLILSLSIFGLNSFLPIKQFGLCLAFTMFMGLFFDLYILPTFITNKTQYTG